MSRRYTIQTLRPAAKFLDKLERSQPADLARIEDAIEALADEPRPTGCKPLNGYHDIWRYRVGNYRICYRIDDGQLIVLVITVSTRDDVYQLLRRHVGR
ncbi:MAG TPA: type II toxin-antitoxin system RelE/ParE family toxin [Pseudonocardiaceae bacterium]|nr:type II toxin-antitoxin system RelE/ParE family toxin [Pseudonocardiaceae bacterium]